MVRREGLDEELYAKGGDVVLIDGPDLAEQIAHATGGEPVALALDPVGGDTYTRLTNSLGDGGTIVAYGMLSGKPASLNTGMAIFKDTRNRSFWLAKWYESATLQEKAGRLWPYHSVDCQWRFKGQCRLALRRRGH